MKLRKDKWEKVKLGEVAKIIMGQSPSSKTYNMNEVGLPFFQGKTEFTDKYPIAVKWCSKPNKIAEPNDILITVRAPVGSTNIANQKCCIGRGIAAIRSKDSNDYILCYLNRIEKELILKGTGTIFGGISGKILSDLLIPLPPLSEQKQISSLFQSIEKAMEEVEGEEKNLHNLLQLLINDFVNDKSKHRKSTLIKLKFGDIAENISERIEPKNAIGQIFIGLDHLDPREITISRFGKPDNLIGTKLKVYKGDIIFGKRNAYLRKAAVANFDGICSAHAMVIRAKPNKVIKGYLPYFMHSDSFMSRAKEISEGSISPTIKWKNLERQEFSIPDLKTQEKILEIFNQLETTLTQLKHQKTTLKNLKGKLLEEILG